MSLVGCEYDDSVSITVLPVPQITYITPDVSICYGDTIQLKVAGLATDFLWSHGPIGRKLNVSPDTTTIYKVAAISGLGCEEFAEAEVEVTVLPLPQLPIITPSDTVGLCRESTIKLRSTITDNIVWSTEETTADITVSNPGKYWVTHTGANGCIKTDSAVVVLPDEPYIDLTESVIICDGQSIDLTVKNGDSFEWSTGETTRTINVGPTSTSDFYVTIGDVSSCTYVDTVTVIVLPQDAIPEAAQNMFPHNNADNLLAPVSLSWLPSKHAITYDLFF